MVAYNKLTGAPVWKSRDDGRHVSPMLVTLAGRRQILVRWRRSFGGAGRRLVAVERAWNTDMGINVSQPIIVDKNRFFLSSGYGKGLRYRDHRQWQELSDEAIWKTST